MNANGRRTVRARGDAAIAGLGKDLRALAGSGRAHRDTLRQVQMLAEHVRTLEGKRASR